MVRISKRPINIPKLSSHLAASGKGAKLPVGPITLPMPGPTFATAVIEPEILVTGSRPSALKQPAIKMMVIKNHVYHL